MTTAQGSAVRADLRPCLKGFSGVSEIICDIGFVGSGLLPFRMDRSGIGPVDAAVCVRAEEITLSLRQVERQIGRSISIEVGQARRHGGDGDTHRLRRRDNPSPARLRPSTTP